MKKKVKVFFEEVSYTSEPEIRLLSRRQYLALKAENAGRPVICRIATPEDEKEIATLERQKWRERYTAAIAEKYRMPANWRENRWFVEQVRPTL